MRKIKGRFEYVKDRKERTMATYKPDYNLVIAVDPGFDSTKIVINGIMFNVPNCIVDISGKMDSLLWARKSGFLLSHYIDGNDYLVGREARKLLLQQDTREKQLRKRDMMDSYLMFTTQDFEINLFTTIGLALVKYSEYSKKKDIKPVLDIQPGDSEDIINKNRAELKRFSLIIGVSLPNDAVASAWPSVKQKLIGDHQYSIETEDGYYGLSFTVKPGYVTILPQATTALLGAACDDEGYEDENSAILSKLPVLVIDGGYKTIGLVKLTTTRMTDQAESNTDFAMGNVHKRVAERIRNEYKRNDIYDFNIPSILEDQSNDGEIVYVNEDGNTESLNVRDMVWEEVEKVCDELIEYINKKYENLVDIRQILVTGGTGAAYYDHILEYVKGHRKHLEKNVILTDYEFLGMSIKPIYAIAVGMYKVLLNQIRPE